MSSPSSGHADLGPELRQMAALILERLDPAVRSLATLAAARSSAEPGKCQQVWCPVCAVAALATGEEHPLLTVLAEHSVNLLTMLHTLLDETGVESEGDGTAAPPPSANGRRYQHIPINIED